MQLKNTARGKLRHKDLIQLSTLIHKLSCYMLLMLILFFLYYIFIYNCCFFICKIQHTTFRNGGPHTWHIISMDIELKFLIDEEI